MFRVGQNTCLGLGKSIWYLLLLLFV